LLHTYLCNQVLSDANFSHLKLPYYVHTLEHWVAGENKHIVSKYINKYDMKTYQHNNNITKRMINKINILKEIPTPMLKPL